MFARIITFRVRAMRKNNKRGEKFIATRIVLNGVVNLGMLQESCWEKEGNYKLL